MKCCNDARNAIKLWYHENMRVFHDRLTTEFDRQYLKMILTDFFESFSFKKEEIIDVERIIFADFMQGRVIFY